MNIQKHITPEIEQAMLSTALSNAEYSDIRQSLQYKTLKQLLDTTEIDIVAKTAIMIGSFYSSPLSIAIAKEFAGGFNIVNVENYFAKHNESFVGYHTGLSLTATDFDTMMKSGANEDLKCLLFGMSLQFDFINEIDIKDTFDKFISNNNIDSDTKKHLAMVSLLLNSKLISENQYRDLIDEYIEGDASTEDSDTELIYKTAEFLQ